MKSKDLVKTIDDMRELIICIVIISMEDNST